MGWSWKGAARGGLGTYLKRREKDQDLATQLALAKAKVKIKEKSPEEMLSSAARDWFILTGKMPDVNDPKFLRYSKIKTPGMGGGGGGFNFGNMGGGMTSGGGQAGGIPEI